MDYVTVCDIEWLIVSKESAELIKKFVGFILLQM